MFVVVCLGCLLTTPPTVTLLGLEGYTLTNVHLGKYHPCWDNGLVDRISIVSCSLNVLLLTIPT